MRTVQLWRMHNKVWRQYASPVHLLRCVKLLLHNRMHCVLLALLHCSALFLQRWLLNANMLELLLPRPIVLLPPLLLQRIAI